MIIPTFYKQEPAYEESWYYDQAFRCELHVDRISNSNRLRVKSSKIASRYHWESLHYFNITGAVQQLSSAFCFESIANWKLCFIYELVSQRRKRNRRDSKLNTLLYFRESFPFDLISLWSGEYGVNITFWKFTLYSLTLQACQWRIQDLIGRGGGGGRAEKDYVLARTSRARCPRSLLRPGPGPT